MVGLGAKEGQELNVHKIQGLDDKFWVWETLEEASRPQVDELSKDELHSYFRAWAAQNKGSEDLHDLMHERIYSFE